MPLNRTEILGQAIQILDEYGLSDLSMRRLADALGVQAGAIYWHYANKQSILAAISDRILGGLAKPDSASTTNWQENLATWASALRTALLQHRDAADLVSSTRAAGLGELSPMDIPAEILIQSGWDATTANHSAGAISHFILGHVFEEQSRQQLALVGLVDGSEQLLDDDGFELGLQVFLAGLAGIRADVPEPYAYPD